MEQAKGYGDTAYSSLFSRVLVSSEKHHGILLPVERFTVRGFAFYAAQDRTSTADAPLYLRGWCGLALRVGRGFRGGIAHGFKACTIDRYQLSLVHGME